MTGPVPHAWLDGCKAAHRRLEAVVAEMTDATAHGPSLLPGWTVGHVVAHLARNADSHRGMVEAAQRGTSQPQYPGGRTQRDADIERGAALTADEMRADLAEAHARLEACWDATDDDAWINGLGSGSAGLSPIADCVFRRWREAEIHRLDLGLLGANPEVWDGLSRAYVDVEWERLLPALASRLPDGVSVALATTDRPTRGHGRGERIVFVRAPSARVLGWLMGRFEHPDWPALGPWS
jgi:maleylpyruvate isomerase